VLTARVPGVVGLALGVVLAIPGAARAAPERPPAAVVDGAVRFEVITPSLIRLEHAADRRFEDRRTLTTDGRAHTRPPFTTEVRGGERIIRTSRITLRWRRGSEPFRRGHLRVRIGGRTVEPRPGPNPAPLGGWRRALDHTDGPVALHEGMLSRAGWYLLDDSESALGTRDWFEPRPAREGAYQDLYLFAYGRDYARGLRDLRTLTGPAPLLPRKAFGVWFSRWWPYGEADWRALVGRFRAERVPLDTLSVDTDFKQVHDEAGAAIAAAAVGAPGRPYSWNAWDWNRDLYPDPGRFFRWARDRGIEVGLNLHPSINSRDGRFEATQARAGGGLVPDEDCRVVQADPQGECMVFDWSDRRQLDAYFALHEPFERQGANFWWLDWCCDGSRADARGLTPDTWINKRYFDRQRARGSRWPAFQRIGGSYQLGFGGSGGAGAFAEHRYTIQFTGDTCATWRQLAFASEFTAAAASIGLPYVSHDIGTFFAESPTGTCDKDLSPFLAPRENSLSPEMYARWIQLGAFQPLDRLHSHHGRRLPWEYPEPARTVAADFLRLREALVPYLYTLARDAHDQGLPMTRPLYLQWPDRAAAYEHRTQYTLGRDVLVAPVSRPGNPARVRVWFPPGTWVDWFTGRRHRGPGTKQLPVPLERMPVFVRAGGIVPTQPPVATTPAAPPRALVLTAHRGDGRLSLYDDAGDGLAHERGHFSRTPITQRRAPGSQTLSIGAASGRFAGLQRRRAYEVRFVGVPRPRVVTIGGRSTSGWSYDERARTATVRARRLPTARATRIVLRWGSAERRGGRPSLTG
jgi:alpha-glucosidase (family GH31 glycosyl hydrolase)